MDELEGVIKYQLHHQYHSISLEADIKPLISWRSLLYRLELINQRQDRYQGLGYGNLSQRLASDSDRFIISGSQTGYLPLLSKDDWVLVNGFDISNNSLYSEGLRQPSSEALTHAAVYQSNPNINYVIHVHSPEIWQQTSALNLAFTVDNIPYGSIEIAKAVKALVNCSPDQQVFAMLGHQDGIVSYGPELDSCALSLIQLLFLSTCLT